MASAHGKIKLPSPANYEIIKTRRKLLRTQGASQKLVPLTIASVSGNNRKRDAWRGGFQQNTPHPPCIAFRPRRQIVCRAIIEALRYELLGCCRCRVSCKVLEYRGVTEYRRVPQFRASESSGVPESSRVSETCGVLEYWSVSEYRRVGEFRSSRAPESLRRPAILGNLCGANAHDS